MNKILTLTAHSILAIGISGCASIKEPEVKTQYCSDEWYAFIEERIVTGDGQGHGPDLGSIEWRSVIEFKLGIREDAEVPPGKSDQWCKYISEKFIENPA